MHRTYATRFHEHASILIPGGTLLAAVMVILGDQSPVSLPAMTAPNLAVFLILAYAVGHMLQIVGTLVEALWWEGRQGMPIDWVRQRDKHLLSDDQKRELARHVRGKLGVALPEGVEGLSKGQWYFLTRQLLVYVQNHGQALQLHHLTGNYELNRGISACALAMAASVAIRDPMATLAFDNHDLYGVFFALCIATLAIYQMERFAVQYALELFSSFILAPGGHLEEATSSVPAASEPTAASPRATPAATA